VGNCSNRFCHSSIEDAGDVGRSLVCCSVLLVCVYLCLFDMFISCAEQVPYRDWQITVFYSNTVAAAIDVV